MEKFIVVRHGSNAANQSRCLRAIVGVIVASSEEQAAEIAKGEWTCYPNQHFEFLRPYEASYADKREAANYEPIHADQAEKEVNEKLAD